MSTSEVGLSSDNLPKMSEEKSSPEAEAAIERLKTLLARSTQSSTSLRMQPPTESPSRSGEKSPQMLLGLDETRPSSSTLPKTDFDLSSLTIFPDCDQEEIMVFKVQITSGRDDMEALRHIVRRQLLANFFNVKVDFVAKSVQQRNVCTEVLMECGHIFQVWLHHEAGDLLDCKVCGFSRKVQVFSETVVL